MANMKEVCLLPNGYMLYCEDNEVGGHRYWSDEIGGGVVIWDTALVDMSTLLAAMVEEQRYLHERYQEEK